MINLPLIKLIDYSINCCSSICMSVFRLFDCSTVYVFMPVSHCFTFSLTRGNCSSDKLIRDNTRGVWLPVVELRPGAGFTHLKLLSETGRVCGDFGGWVGFFFPLYSALTVIHSGFLYFRKKTLFSV